MKNIRYTVFGLFCWQATNGEGKTESFTNQSEAEIFAGIPYTDEMENRDNEYWQRLLV